MPEKTFCELLKEAVKDEWKAHNKDYPKLKAKTDIPWGKTIDAIIADEGRHYGILEHYYKRYCKRHKKGSLRAMGGEEIDPSQYGAVITSEGIYRPRRRRRR